MRRREFIAGIGGAAVWPVAARAQKQTMPVIGVLSVDPVSRNGPTWLEFRRGLTESGFFEGQNITFEFRVAGENIRWRQIVDDLLNQHPAVVLVIGGPSSILELKAATSTVPIVFISGLDPISYGFVESVARPGGNVTGINYISTELIGKRLDLLLELVPQAKIIGNLSPPADSVFFKEWTTKTLEAAKALGREVVVHPVRENIDIEKAFVSFAGRGVSGITVDPVSTFDDPLRGRAVIEFATFYKIPAVYGGSYFPRQGGLMSYSANFPDMWHQLATQYVARILKGTKPADLPVQQPTKFELVINLRTAKALGLEVRRTLLAIADEVIEYMRYGRLGVRFWAITQDMAANLHLQSTRGVIVTDVDESGAAKPAGIQAGDVIMRMDGKEIVDLRDLPRIVAGTPANKAVEIVIIRAGVEKSINVTLGPGIPPRTR